MKVTGIYLENIYELEFSLWLWAQDKKTLCSNFALECKVFRGMASILFDDMSRNIFLALDRFVELRLTDSLGQRAASISPEKDGKNKFFESCNIPLSCLESKYQQAFSPLLGHNSQELCRGIFSHRRLGLSLDIDV